jgi:hypothetical protein
MKLKGKEHPCWGCEETLNCINGLYCTRLKGYLEYAQTKPCKES